MLAFAPLMQLLLDTYGWRGTMLITSAVVANVCAAGAVLRPVSASSNISDNQENPENESDPHDDDRSCNRESSETEQRGGKPARTFSRKSLSFLCVVAGLATLFRLDLLRQSYRFSIFCFAQTTYIMSYGCFVLYLIPCATTSGVSSQNASF